MSLNKKKKISKNTVGRNSQARVQDEADELRDKLEQVKEALMRSQAEFVNYRRRKEEEQVEFVSYAAAKTLGEVIEVLDNFKRAIDNLPKELSGNDWVDGVVQIEKQFESTLLKLGVEKIPSLGESYNPELHEAVMRDKGKQDEILEELEIGYKLNGKVLRPAKVKVGDGTVK